MLVNEIKWLKNSDVNDSVNGSDLSECENIEDFHRSFPQYTVTPLTELGGLALELGVKGIYVKDESYRFKLNSFKALGCSYAVASYIARRLNIDKSSINYELFTSDYIKNCLGSLTFYAATDGNHGRAVAWTAKRIGQKSVILVPNDFTQAKMNELKKEGADIRVTPLNYSDMVKTAGDMARQDPNGVGIQDTSWEGYTDIPKWIMQGYYTMIMEAGFQLRAVGVKKPTHIFIQTGTGTLAAAVISYFSNLYSGSGAKRAKPVFVIVESSAADCLYRSANENRMVSVKGETLMSDLSMGEVNPIAWDIIKSSADFFISVPDYVGIKGMRILAAPVKSDKQISSGMSGAVTAGLTAEIMTNSKYKALKDDLNLNRNSEILLFNTEGNSANYRKIVWSGAL